MNIIVPTKTSDLVNDSGFNNKEYSTGDSSTSGLTKLYTSTGNGTDGSMTQNAITNALNNKASENHAHSTSDITSGTLPLSRGGTGGTSAATARANLGALNLISSESEPTSQNVGDIWFKEV